MSHFNVDGRKAQHFLGPLSYTTNHMAAFEFPALLLYETIYFEHESPAFGRLGTKWFLASVPAFVSQLLAGVLEGHAAVLVPQLTDETSPVVISKDEKPWIASLGFILTPVFAVVGKPLMDTFGRKCNLYLFYILSTFGFLAVSVASTPSHIYLGRVLSSAAYGLSTCSFAYVAEICADGQKSNFLFALSLMRSVGLLVVYSLGAILPWNIDSMVFAVTSHLALLYVFHIPQSPAWLVSQGRLEEAGSSLKWLRNDHDTAEKEIAALKTAMPEEEFQQRSGIAAFFNPAVFKPFATLVAYAFLQHATGVFAILNYAHDFFDSLNSNYNPSYILICVAFYRVLTTAFWVYVFNKFDKLFLTSSAAFAAGCMLLLAFAWQTAYPDAIRRNDALQLMSVSLCASYVLIGSAVDVQNIPVDLRTVFAPNVLGAARGGIKFTSYLLVFLSLLCYPLLSNAFGLTRILLLFGTSSLAFGFLMKRVLPKFANKLSTESSEGTHLTNLQLSTYL